MTKKEPYYCPTCDPLKEGIGCAGHSRSLKEIESNQE